MIHKHDTWKHLLRVLCRAYPQLAPYTRQQLSWALGTPMALSQAINAYMPNYAAKPHLHLVVAGVETGPDLVDNGAWYALVPMLLGIPPENVTIALVGPHINSSYAGNVFKVGLHTNAKTLFPKVTITQHQCTLEGYLANNACDLAFLAHPGMENFHTEWFFSTSNFLTFTNTIFAMSSFSRAQLDEESWLMLGYGALVNKETTFSNKFKNEAKTDTTNTLSQHSIISRILPTEPDPARLDIYDDYTKWYNELIRLNKYSLKPELMGVAHNIPNHPELSKIVTFPNGLITIQDGLVWSVSPETQQLVMSGIQLPKSLLESYPSHLPSGFEYRLWLKTACTYIADRISQSVVNANILKAEMPSTMSH